VQKTFSLARKCELQWPKTRKAAKFYLPSHNREYWFQTRATLTNRNSMISKS
jgi:hypothetical protein